MELAVRCTAMCWRHFVDDGCKGAEGLVHGAKWNRKLLHEITLVALVVSMHLSRGVQHGHQDETFCLDATERLSLVDTHTILLSLFPQPTTKQTTGCDEICRRPNPKPLGSRSHRFPMHSVCGWSQMPSTWDFHSCVHASMAMGGSAHGCASQRTALTQQCNGNDRRASTGSVGGVRRTSGLSDNLTTLATDTSGPHAPDSHQNQTHANGETGDCDGVYTENTHILRGGCSTVWETVGCG